jgi:hypothetical protein
MGITALIIATILYIIVSISCFINRDYPHALSWFAYSIANVGFIWYEIEKVKL